MRAYPGDYKTFREYLSRLAIFGNGQSLEEAKLASKILTEFDKAESGVIGRKCACGKEGFASRAINFSCARLYVLCKEHTDLFDKANQFIHDPKHEEDH